MVELVESILEEAAEFATGVLDPINRAGDSTGSVCKDGVVTTAPGFKEAKLLVETGWNFMPFSPEFGGQGMPAVVSMAVNEMWKSANMAFGLCPMLTGGAIEAIAHHASDELKQKYLHKMVEGTWSGTMNLTEQSAGSGTSSAPRPKAVGDGSYLVSGTKIFITWGENDCANIIHLVLAVCGRAAGTEGDFAVHRAELLVVRWLACAPQRPDLRFDRAQNGHSRQPDGGDVLQARTQAPSAIWWATSVRGIGYMSTMMNHARVNVWSGRRRSCRTFLPARAVVCPRTCPGRAELATSRASRSPSCITPMSAAC